MGSEWREISLSEIAEIIMGQSPTGDTCNEFGKGLALLNGPTEFGSHHPLPVQFSTDPRKRAQEGDILFCVRGSTTGRMNWADQEYAIGRGIAAIRHKNGREYQPFLKGLMDCRLPELLAQATGSTFPNIAYAQLADLVCTIPPIDEQRAIAHILGTLDDKIELNRKMNETLEAMARAIFKKWFVDAVANGLLKGWRESIIGEEVRVVGGGTPNTSKSEFWKEGNIHWVTPKDLAPLSSPVLLDTERRITNTGVQQISSGILPVGTVLLSSRAPIGYLAISEVPVAVNQGFIAMVCDKVLPNYFVLLWAKENMEAIKANANGTTFLEISKKNFRPLTVVVPPKQILEDFNLKIEPLYRQVVLNLRESRTLATLRDTLLPKLMSGEIDIQGVNANGQ